MLIAVVLALLHVLVLYITAFATMKNKPTACDEDAQQASPQAQHNTSKRALSSLSKKYPRRSLVTQNACSRCQLKKSKCDGKRPSCGRCAHNGAGCAYDVPTEGMTKMQNMVNQLAEVTRERDSLLDLVHASLPESNHSVSDLLSRLDFGEDAKDIVANLRADSLISTHNNLDHPFSAEQNGFINSSSTSQHSFDHYKSSRSSAATSDYTRKSSISWNHADQQDSPSYQSLPDQQRLSSHINTGQRIESATDVNSGFDYLEFRNEPLFGASNNKYDANTSDESIPSWQMTSPQPAWSPIDRPMRERLGSPTINGQHQPRTDESRSQASDHDDSFMANRTGPSRQFD